MLHLIDKLDVTVTRWDDTFGTVRGVEIAAGEPDANGNRRLVSVYQQNWGQGFIIQTNFIEFYEQRGTLEQALGVALYIASDLAENGAHVDPDLIAENNC